jgi:hypothetical protein
LGVAWGWLDGGRAYVADTGHGKAEKHVEMYYLLQLNEQVSLTS